MESYSFTSSNAVWPCWPYGVILGLDVGGKMPDLQEDGYLCVGGWEVLEFKNLGLAFLIVLLPEDILLIVRGKINIFFSKSKIVLSSLSSWHKGRVKWKLYF